MFRLLFFILLVIGHFPLLKAQCGLPDLNIPDTITICPEQRMIINASTPGASSYLWNNGYKSPYIRIQEPGTYWVKVFGNDSTCYKTDTVTLKHFEVKKPDLGKDTLLCSYNQLTLDAGEGYKNYEWLPPGESTRTKIVNNVGFYSVTVRDSNNCTLGDTVYISIIMSIPPRLGPDTSLCKNNEYIFMVPDSYHSYLWQDGSTENFYKPKIEDSLITVTVSVKYNNTECFEKDSVIVNFQPYLCNNIAGKIRAGDIFSDKAIVNIFSVENGEYSKVYSRRVDSLFRFDNIEKRNYILQVLPDSNSVLKSKFLPTYYQKSLTWQEATQMAVEEDLYSNMSIELIPFTTAQNFTGNETLKGVITQSASILREEEESFLPNAIVYLLNQDKQKIVYTYSNAQGAYTFKSLTAGDYFLMAEYPGTKTQIYPVTVDGNTSTTEELYIALQKQTLGITKEYIDNSLLKLYPNPSNKNVFISLSKETKELSNISVFNHLGEIVLNDQKQINESTELRTEYLSPGIYFIQVSVGNVVYNGKLIKQ